MVYHGKTQIALLGLAAPVALGLAAFPRWALYQFVILMFLQVRLLEAPTVYLTDLSALLVVLAAAIDVLCDRGLPRSFPRLTGNFALLFAAVFVCALFSAEPSAAVNPLARIGLLAVTFVSIHRLAPRSGIESLLKVFFFTASAHALIVLVQFVAASGAERAFGFSPATFSWLAMIALPVGLVFYLSERSGKSAVYLAGCLLVLGAMVGTQSRLPLLFVLVLAVTVAVLTGRRLWSLPEAGERVRALGVFRRRLWVLSGLVVLAAAVSIAVQPALFERVLERFGRLLTLEPTGTVRLRLTLWGFALDAFRQHPLLGIGPGTFRGIQDLIPTLRLDEVSWWIRGLSAHNLFLHYLAETGIVGTSALVALFVNLFRVSRRVWRRERGIPVASRAVLYTLGIMFLVTTFIEAGWMWGQSGFALVLFAALTVRAAASPTR